MAFINGVEVSNTTKRVVTFTGPGIPSGPPTSFCGGLLFSNGDPLNPTLQIDATLEAGNSYGEGGVMRDGGGQMLVTGVEPGGTPIFNNGLWVTPAGLVVVTAADPIAAYSHGWPVSAKGALCV